jgi:hypothetical protein
MSNMLSDKQRLSSLVYFLALLIWRIISLMKQSVNYRTKKKQVSLWALVPVD